MCCVLYVLHTLHVAALMKMMIEEYFLMVWWIERGHPLMRLLSPPCCSCITVRWAQRNRSLHVRRRKLLQCRLH